MKQSCPWNPEASTRRSCAGAGLYSMSSFTETSVWMKYQSDIDACAHTVVGCISDLLPHICTIHAACTHHFQPMKPSSLLLLQSRARAFNTIFRGNQVGDDTRTITKHSSVEIWNAYQLQNTIKHMLRSFKMCSAWITASYVTLYLSWQKKAKEEYGTLHIHVLAKESIFHNKFVKA